MRVLVTGANGFVGKAICNELAQNSISVIKLIRKKRENFEDLNSKIVFADITDIDLLKIANDIGRVDAVIHTAGLAHQFGNTPKEAFWDVNVVGTENVAKLAKSLEAKHFILISSVSVYGETIGSHDENGITEESNCHPEGFYGESKYESETICREILKKTNINLTILRLATVIGEGDQGNVFSLINLINSGKFLWIGNGKNKKSLIYKGDVAKAVTFLLQNKKNKIDVFNLSAKAISMKAIVETVSKCLNVKIFPMHLPTGLINFCLKLGSKVTKANKVIQLEKSIHKWGTDDSYSNKSLFEEYRFLPKTSIEEALEKEVNWYLKKSD